jgi:hypothetical protein
MSLPTKLAITGLWGRGADAAGVPDACGRNGAENMRPPHFARKPSEMLASPPERQRVPGKTSRFQAQKCLVWL